MKFDPKTQIVYSVDGQLRTNDGFATDLKQVVQAIPAGNGPIVVWFHGGLISTKAGVEIATRVGKFYASGYPGVEETIKPNLPADPHSIFFVWESGPGKSLMDAVIAIIERAIIKSAIDKLTNIIGFKLSELTGRGLAATETAETLELSETEQKVLYDALMADAEFVSELNAATGTQLSAAPAGEAATPEKRKASDSINQFIQENMPTDDKQSLDFGGKIAWAIVKGMAKITGRVLLRIHRRRGHGTKQTIIEETVRELQIPEVWRQMKRYTDAAFDDDGVGTKFLVELKARADLKDRPIMLVGHSTGAIYIMNLLKSKSAAGLDFHVRFLAPAIRFDRFAESLKASQGKIASFRTYGMKDSVEYDEALLDFSLVHDKPALRDFYKGSLLYMVSGALEAQTEGDPDSGGYGDCPLVGMERFGLSSAALTDEEKLHIEAVRKLHPVDLWVYGPTVTGAPFPCASITHGGFDDIDSQTGRPESALWSLLLP